MSDRENTLLMFVEVDWRSEWTNETYFRQRVLRVAPHLADMNCMPRAHMQMAFDVYRIFRVDLHMTPEQAIAKVAKLIQNWPFWDDGDWHPKEHLLLEFIPCFEGLLK